MDTQSLPPADNYINRELSLIEFNRRVLEQAKDPNTPILERLRFLCISCTNLDEFFEVRIASLKQRHEIGAPAPGPDTLTPEQLLDEIRHRALVHCFLTRHHLRGPSPQDHQTIRTPAATLPQRDRG